MSVAYLPMLSRSGRVALLGMFLLIAADLKAQEFYLGGERIWTDSSGNFRAAAKLLTVDKDSVRLLKPDGRIISVPVARLSKADYEYLESLHRPNLIEPAKELAVPAAAGPVVLVGSAHWPENVAPAIVFHVDDQRAYLCCPRLPVLVEHMLTREPAEGEKSPPLPRAAVRWGAGASERTVEAEVISRCPLHGLWFLVVPRNQAPAPLARGGKAEVSESLNVQVCGYAIKIDREGLRYSRVVERGTIGRIERSNESSLGALLGPTIDSFVVDGLESDVVCGIVMTEAGEPIGYVAERSARGRPLISNRAPKSSVVAQPLRRLAKLRNPECRAVAFAPVRGDAKKVTYEFAACIHDPFGLFDSPRFYASRPESDPSADNPLDNVLGARGAGGRKPWTDVAQKAPSQRVQEQMEGMLYMRAGTYWVGYIEDENPGEQRPIRYGVDIQFTLNDATRALPRQYVNYPTSEFKEEAKASSLGTKPKRRPRLGPPDIPGFDGLPVDYPRPVKHKNGGYQVTLEATRVKDGPAGGRGPFPKPVRKERPLVGKRAKELSWEVTEISLPVKVAVGYNETARASMAYSGDGRWIYVVDARDVLHRFDAAGLVEQDSLEFGTRCNGLAMSQAGLVAALVDKGVLWVIDPANLEVLREIPAQSVLKIAAAATTPLGFAYCSTKLFEKEPGDSRRPAQSLAMIDLAAGKVLHRIPSMYNGHPMTVDGKVWFSGSGWPGDNRGDLSLQMTADGKYLFLGGPQISRLRIEGGDLVYEEGCYSTQFGTSLSIYVGPDGRRAVIPKDGYAERQSSVIDAMRLSDKKCDLDEPSQFRCVAIDAKTGQIFVAEYGALCIFGPRGGCVARIRDIAAIGMAPSPAGEQLLILDIRRGLLRLQLERRPSGGEGGNDMDPELPDPRQFVRDIENWREFVKVQPRTTRKLLLDETNEVGGAKIASLKLDHESLNGMEFSDDGKAAILVRGNGILRLSLENFRDVVELRMYDAKPVAAQPWLGCKEGIVVRLGASQLTPGDGMPAGLDVRGWLHALIDPATLSVKRLFVVQGKITGFSPVSSLLVVSGYQDGGGGRDETVLYDLAKGKVTDALTPGTYVSRAKDASPTQDEVYRLKSAASRHLQQMKLSADGRMLIAPDSLWSVTNGRLKAMKVVRGDFEPRHATSDPGCFVSLVNREYSFYMVDKPASPSARIPQFSNYACAFVLAPAKKRIYALVEKDLRVMEYQGKEVARYALAVSDHRPFLAASPDGNRVIVSDNDTLYLVTLPDSPR